MKIYLDMVGCRLNQSELEIFARQFTRAGHRLTGDPAEADLAVVNTCTVTTAAAADSRKMIRRLHRAGVKEVVVTGCWSTLEPEAAARLPGVGEVIANEEKQQLVARVLDLAPGFLQRPAAARKIIPGARLRTRANIKVQDGCDHRCTYCITTIARGEGSSIPAAKVVQQVRSAVEGGSREVVLTGVQLGSWGSDLEEDLALHDLVLAVLQETEVPRVRLSSLEPWDVEQELIELLTSDRVARHLHLPLQSGSDRVLQRMGRKISTREYAALLEQIRRVVPETAITTDVMAGFPGEGEQEFQESVEFVRAMNFADGHVFTYSARPGTRAAAMEGQVDHRLRKSRNARLREILADSSRRYRERFLGREVDVLWESVEEQEEGPPLARGLSGNYLRVQTFSAREIRNTITPVTLSGLTGRGMQGRITA